MNIDKDFITILPIFPDKIQTKLTLYSSTPEMQFIKQINEPARQEELINILLESLLDLVNDDKLKIKILNFMLKKGVIDEDTFI